MTTYELVLKVEDFFKKQNVNIFLFLPLEKNVYRLYVRNIEMGFSHQLDKSKDWDVIKEQTRFYSEFLNLPFQYALE